MVKNLPAIEGRVQSLGQEDPLNPLQYSCLENPHGQGSLAGYSPWGCKESDMADLQPSAFLVNSIYIKK